MKKVNHRKQIRKYLSFNFVLTAILLLSCSKTDDGIYPDPTVVNLSSISYKEGTVILCKWKDNKKAALTLNFDDSSNGQATLAIPALNERNMKGTFYVNPGYYTYIANKTIWEALTPETGHELANHTMHHSGASTREETFYEVGEAAKEIWKIRGDADCGSLIAFNRGGGTSWNEQDLADALAQFCCYDRQEPIGESYESLSVDAGSNASQMYAIVPTIIERGRLGRCHFHGIAAENGNPPNDGGESGVWIEEFKSFLDMVKKAGDKLWQPTFSEAFKYAKERNNSTISINKPNDESYSITLNCTLNKQYFDQVLTLVVCVPKTWTKCTVEYNGNNEKYSISDGFVVLNIKPGYGAATITKN